MEKTILEKLDFGSGEIDIREVDVSLDDLRPYFSVHISKVDELEWKNVESKLELVEWPSDVEVCFQQITYEEKLREISEVTSGNLLALITVLTEKPPWGKETPIRNVQFDLHIFYYHTEDNLLFEATTSKKIAKKIRLAIAKDAEDVPAHKIMGLLNTGDRFFTVGLRNVINLGTAQPDYKLLKGPQAHFAVVPTDKLTFAMSYALRRYSEDEVRGISTFRSSAWATHRDTIEGLRVWCNDLADGFKVKVEDGGPLRLAFSKEIDKLEEMPLAVYLDHSFLRGELTIRRGNDIIKNVVPHMEIKCFSEEDGLLFCNFCFKPNGESVNVLYSAGAEPFWKNIDVKDLHITLDFSDEEDFDGNLCEYLERFPPSLVMPGGGVVIKNERWKPAEIPGLLPQGCLTSLTWNKCDIYCEAGEARPGLYNIQDWVVYGLVDPTCKEIECVSENAIIINDHGSGEIADIIVIDPTEGEKRIEFYHCKAAHGEVPSVRVTDAYEVLGQACRNGQWVLSPTLMEELYRRTKSPRKSPILKGTKKNMKKLCKDFICNEWKYKVVAVQPGFDCIQIKGVETKKSKKAYPLFVSTYEWLHACRAEFSVWGRKP